MNFIHQAYQPGETIAAIATPIGEGGVAIIRISGNQAIEIANKVFTGSVDTYRTHTAHYGKVVTSDGVPIDDVLLLVMLGRRSYTGEDTIEIHCHGGSLITRRVLEVILTAGARQALPGEFTFRAFMNGKLDLTQAEAVQELISAKNERALDAAKNQLEGSLSRKITIFQKRLTHIAAILEAWVDFPEEGLEFASFDEVCLDLEDCFREMQTLVDTYHNGRILHEGVSLCLVGKPNVGKSSLMNAMLEKSRAIVSPTPGTTRDIIEDNLRLNGLNFRLIDTAGIRETEESIEKEGIQRTHQAMIEADLILLLLDSHLGLDDQDHQILSQIPSNKTLIVWNKADMAANQSILSFPHVSISAKYRTGFQELYDKIEQMIWEKGVPSKEEVVITNVRHKEALVASLEAGKKVLHGLISHVSPEFLSFDMRHCLKELGKVIGTDITEDILSAIFSKFCVGK